ncbi:MAG: hypothetical protein QXD31_01200 [Candidatus Caldarchaeum sp.]
METSRQRTVIGLRRFYAAFQQASNVLQTPSWVLEVVEVKKPILVLRRR